MVESINARPPVIRAYAKAKEIDAQPTVTGGIQADAFRTNGGDLSRRIDCSEYRAVSVVATRLIG